MSESNLSVARRRPRNGGTQHGAGRKPGSANLRTREIADQAAREGITPLEVQIRTMRALWEKATDKDGKVIDLDKAKEACDVARDAAPYMHPRLAPIDYETGKSVPVGAGLDDLELGRAIAFILECARRRLADKATLIEGESVPG